MSYCKQSGKDQIIFVTKEDHETPSTVVLPDGPSDRKGLISDNGEINWDCPCLGGMATGPCGIQFREAFSCFHYSQAENKGSDCVDKFREMQVCMSNFPSLYPRDKGDTDKKENNEALMVKKNTDGNSDKPVTNVNVSKEVQMKAD